MRSIILFLTGLILGPLNLNAQIPAARSARAIPTEVEQSETRVNLIISGAEDHFRKGKTQLEKNQRENAREEFDKAIDTILESGFDVRASQRLQTFYLDLVERIYREEAPLHQRTNADTTMLVAQNTQTKKQNTPLPTIGFRHQKVISSPTDELSKLVLRREIQTKNSSPSETISSSSETKSGLGDLRHDYVQATKEYQASLTKLIPLYEAEVRRGEEKLAVAKKLHAEGLLLQSQLEEAARNVESARDKVIETRKQIARADEQIAAVEKEIIADKRRAEALVKVERSRQVNHSSTVGQIPHQLPDGRVPTVVRYLEDNLNDPYSMKLLKWSRVRKVYLANRQPYWYVTLRLRAKNGFGAYILKEAGFYLRHNKVVFTHNL
jgi:hypothetical protein